MVFQKAQNSDIEKGIIENSLKKTFSPEFLNRVDEIVVFNSLEKDDIRKIVDIEISKLVDRVTNLGYHISITEKAKDFICENGYDKKNGARPLNRAIQKFVENLIAEEIVNSKIKEGDQLNIDHYKNDGFLTLTSKKSKKKTD